jgi:hypothetical protein
VMLQDGVGARGWDRDFFRYMSPYRAAPQREVCEGYRRYHDGEGPG